MSVTSRTVSTLLFIGLALWLAWPVAASEATIPLVDIERILAQAEIQADAQGPAETSSSAPRVPAFQAGLYSQGAGEPAAVELPKTLGDPIWVGKICEEVMTGMCMCMPGEAGDSCNPVECGDQCDGKPEV